MPKIDADEWQVKHARPVEIDDYQSISELLGRNQVCLVEFDLSDAVASIRKAAIALGLRRPFVTKFNRRNGVGHWPGNIDLLGGHATAVRRGSSRTGKALGLHVSGAYERAGVIQTAFLLCLEQAALGGEITLLHTTRAFEALEAQDWRLAAALTHKPDVQTVAPFARVGREHVGPPFERKPEGLVSRFGLDAYADWSFRCARVPCLEEAVGVFVEMVERRGPLYHEILLKSGHGLIFANHKIAHGRNQFVDTSCHTRMLLRALYADGPRPRQQSGHSLQGASRMVLAKVPGEGGIELVSCAPRSAAFLAGAAAWQPHKTENAL